MLLFHVKGKRVRKHQKLRRGLIAVLMAALLSTIALPTAQAAQWGDTGSGSSGGKTGGSGIGGTGQQATCGQNLGRTHGVLYYKSGSSWKRFSDYSYPNCVSPYTRNTWKTTGHQHLRESGFLVYRFYGTYENPTRAVTRSRLNLTQWGAHESLYQFAPVWGLDAGGTKVPTGYTRGTNSQMRADGRTKKDSYTLRNAAGQLAPAYPKKVKGKCQNLQTDGILRSWYKNTASQQEKIAMRATLGRVYWLASREGRYPATGLAEAGLRTIKRGYRFNWNQWQKDTTKAPPRHSKGDSYYITDFTWETRDCASPILYAGEQEVKPEKRPVVGACYIQTKRKTVTRSNGSRNVLLWHSLEYRDKSGERFTDFYKGKKYTPSGSGGDGTEAKITGLTTSKQKKLIKSWRKFMHDDFKKWHNQIGGFSNSRGAQILPANPYVGDLNASKIGQVNSTSRNKAAKTLQNSSRCRITTTALFDIPRTPPPNPPSVSTNLKVTNQEVYQVSPTEAVIKVTRQSPTCNGKACGKNVKVKTLDWAATLKGTGSYKLCKVNTISAAIPMNCDGIYTDKSSKTGSIKKSQTFQVRFAAATDPSQAVQLSLSKMRGTFEFGTTTKGLKISGVDPLTGQTYKVDTGNLTSVSTHPISVKASGSPVKLTKTSTGYTYKLPVIGAVQVPR